MSLAEIHGAKRGEVFLKLRLTKIVSNSYFIHAFEPPGKRFGSWERLYLTVAAVYDRRFITSRPVATIRIFNQFA
jgi:hypothetical protein